LGFESHPDLTYQRFLDFAQGIPVIQKRPQSTKPQDAIVRVQTEVVDQGS
jgi:hypothetical protein